MKPPITPAMSIRSGTFFGQSPTFWHSIQVECDFRALARKRKQLVPGIQPASSLVIRASTRNPLPKGEAG